MLSRTPGVALAGPARFYMTQAALPHLEEGCTIVNSTSVTAYRGSHHLVDYAATKGAIVAFTRPWPRTSPGAGSG